jgi:hypothetical protein
MAHEKVIFFPGIGANIDPSSNLLIEKLQQVSGTLGMELKVAATTRQDAAGQLWYLSAEEQLERNDTEDAFLLGHSLGALPVMLYCASRTGIGSGMIIAPPDKTALDDVGDHAARLAQYFGGRSSCEAGALRLRNISTNINCNTDHLRFSNDVVSSVARRVLSVTVQYDKLYPDWHSIYEPSLVLQGSSHSLLQPGVLSDEFTDLVGATIQGWVVLRR